MTAELFDLSLRRADRVFRRLPTRVTSPGRDASTLGAAVGQSHSIIVLIGQGFGARGCLEAVDGDPGTRWTTGAAQAAGEWYRVDLGAGSWFNRVVIDVGADNPGDQPRRFNVETSNDGSSWTTVATGYGTDQVTTVNVPITQARYLWIR